MKTKEDLVLIEAFSFIKMKVIYYTNVKKDHLVLVLLPEIYQNGNQLVFTIIQVILI